MIKIISILAILVSLLILACTREHQPLDPKDAGNFVVRPQVDVPWPSLADSPWPMHHGNPQSTGRSRYAGPSQGKVAWRYDSGGQIGTSIVIGADSTIYFGNDNVIKGEEHHSYLNAVRQDGSLKWRFDIGHTSFKQGCSPIVAADGTIYIGSTTGQFFAVHPDGSKKWVLTIGESIETLAPNIGLDGVIYFVPDYQQPLYAINPDGSLHWECTEKPFNGVFVLSISPDGQTLYVGCQGISAADTNYGLAAVDLNGNIKWIFNVGEIYSSPIVDNEGNLFFSAGLGLGSKDSTKTGIFSVDANGIMRWKYNLRYADHLGGTMDYNGRVYFTGCDSNNVNQLFAFDHDGKLVWRFDKDHNGFPGGQHSSLICDSRGISYCATWPTIFFAITPEGNLRWQVEIGDVGWLSPAISSGLLYIGSYQQSDLGRSLVCIQ